MKNPIQLAATSLALLLTTAAHASVLIIGAPASSSWNDDVQAKIAGTGLISGSVDVFNASVGTPSLALLQSYSSVLFYSDASFADRVALGNVLADYVDAGGGAVQAVFSFYSSGLDVGGRWRAEGYDVWAPGTQSSGQLTLGTIHQPGSPILAGVTSFDGGSSSYYNTVGALNPGAVAVADWSNGTSLIAENLTSFNGRVVGLNFYPPSSDARSDFWNASSDGALIMANALNHVANATPPSTSVPDGGSMLAMLGVALAALGLIRRKLG
jgi:hypothetical protein